MESFSLFTAKQTGNAVMKEEWRAISAFSSFGYASVYDNRLKKYIIIDKAGRTVRDSQSYIEPYYPSPDIFICRNTFDTANSYTDYYVLEFFLYSLKRNKTISEFDSYDDLLKTRKEFIEECRKAYVDHYEHSVITESYDGVFIRYDEGTDTYLLTDENGRTVFKPGPNLTGLTYLKGKVIQGVSKSTGKIAVIFNKGFK